MGTIIMNEMIIELLDFSMKKKLETQNQKFLEEFFIELRERQKLIRPESFQSSNKEKPKVS